MEKGYFGELTLKPGPRDSPIDVARRRSDAELKKAFSTLKPHDFGSSVPVFHDFTDSVKLLFNEEATELLHTSADLVTFKRDVCRLFEKIVNEYTRAFSQKMMKRQRRLLERPMSVDDRLPYPPNDKWDLFAPAGLLPDKKHAVRKELRRVLGQELPYWLHDAREFDRHRPPSSKSGAMPTDFWDNLRLGFMTLREECAIDARTAPAGRLTAIWTAVPQPGRWRLNYWNGKDGSGVAVRFGWHAQSAATRLGFKGSDEAAVHFWLDRVKGDAPASHLKTLTHVVGPNGEEEVYSVEILDICGLSADYCSKCQSDEMRSMSISARPAGDLQALPATEIHEEQLARDATKVQTGVILSLGHRVYAPRVTPQRVFPAKRHSLPEAPEELTKEFDLLAQEAIILVTRDTSNLCSGVDDWLDRLQSEGHPWKATMEQLLAASRDHLREMRVYELSIGHNDQAERCGTLAERFAELLLRFCANAADVRRQREEREEWGRAKAPTARPQKKVLGRTTRTGPSNEIGRKEK